MLIDQKFIDISYWELPICIFCYCDVIIQTGSNSKYVNNNTFVKFNHIRILGGESVGHILLPLDTHTQPIVTGSPQSELVYNSSDPYST